MNKKFNLSKQESDQLSTIIQVTQIQEQVLLALQERSKNHVISILKRCGYSAEAFERTKIELGSGNLTIEEPKKEKTGEVKK